MAKGVGLDAGVFEVKVVELDGSYRRPRLTKVSIDRVASPDAGATDEGRAQLEAEAALHALKDQKVSRNGVNLGFPCREAVLRNLKIPFVGDDAIRKVIKFEVEGAIHSHNVDDMVVDFQTYERGDGESSVLVVAVPKKPLAALLDALGEHGIDPERVDLDAAALFRAAEWAGCFGEDAAEAAAAAAEAGEEEDLPVARPSVLDTALAGRKARIVVEVGARATRVLALIEDRLIDMRAIRLGADAVAEALVNEFGISMDEARDAAIAGLHTGQDVALEAVVPPELDPAVDAPESEPDLADAAAIQRAEIVPHAAILRARDQFLDRLQRELLRFLAGLPRIAEVERLLITGGGSVMPGVSEALGETFGCQAQPIDVLAKLSHDLDPEEAAQIGPRIAVAVGLALGMLGGKRGFDFRQEDLAYRRHFDRIKFPLAIACMLAVFLPFIYGVRQKNKLEELAATYGALFEVSEDAGARRGASSLRATFFGYVGYLMNNTANNVIRQLGAQRFEELTRKVVERDTFERLPVIREALDRHLREQREQTGVYEDLQLPSGAYVLSYFADVVKTVESQLGSFLISEINLNLSSTRPTMGFEIAIRGDDFRQRFTILQDALRATFAEEGSPFLGFSTSRGATQEDVFRNGTGAWFTASLDIKEEFEPRPQR